MNLKQSTIKKYKLLESIFFSNCFYGVCAVALSVEATLQQRIPLNSFLYFFLFIATILYYSYPYVRRCAYLSTNSRTNWYSENYICLYWCQAVITLILLAACNLFIGRFSKELFIMPFYHWVLIIIFPLLAALYYGINFLPGRYNIRKIGWLKPFVIGFIWAGMVTIYPVLFYDISHRQNYKFNWVSILLFGKNFMFITVLCIMFDIKDYATDYINRLKTFVVKLGLRKTIFYLLLPFSFLGLFSFIYYALAHQFHPGKLLLNLLPFILLIVTTFSLCRRRSLMYYLVIVDGLILVKGVCGSIAMLYF